MSRGSASRGGGAWGKGGIGSRARLMARADAGTGGRCSRLRTPNNSHPTNAKAAARRAMIASRTWIIPRRSLAFGETARTVTLKVDVGGLPAASVTFRLAEYAPGRAWTWPAAPVLAGEL